MENQIVYKDKTPSKGSQFKHKVRKVNDGTLFKIENDDDSDSLLVRIRLACIFKALKFPDDTKLFKVPFTLLIVLTPIIPL